MALALAACRTAAFGVAAHRDSVDGWRAYLAEHQVGAEAEIARQHLEEKEWEAADREATVLGYRRYLTEFSEGPHADDARDRLAALRHLPSDAVLNPADLDTVGVVAGGAEAVLATAEAHGDPGPLRTFLAHAPEGEHSDELRAREDDLSFAEASRGDGRGLRRYLEMHPLARHRTDVEAILTARSVRAMLWEERFVDADLQIHDLGQSSFAHGLATELCERQARVTLASPDGLSDLGPDGLALTLADEGAVAAIAQGLSSDDLNESVQAAWALADTGSPAALDPLLLTLVPEHRLAVRWAARLALARLIEGWPPEVRELELGERRERLRVRAASAPLWIRQAALEDGLGMVEAAETLGRARHDAPEDPLPLADALRRADLQGAERVVVAQQLRGVLGALPAVEACGQRWLMHLASHDQSVVATPACPADGPPPSVVHGESRRLAAIAALGKLPMSPVLAAQLGRVAERDGSAAVRAAAKALLGSTDTLKSVSCAGK